MKTNLTILLTALSCVATHLAAQSAAYAIQTNLPGVTAAAEPPAWLDPLTATDADLAAYGFPPRPDAQTQPERLRSWQRAMAHPKHLIVPNLGITNVTHSLTRAVQVLPNNPQVNPEPPVPYDNATAFETPNWSAAVAVLSDVSSFGASSFHTISAEYVVPVAPQPTGDCTATWESSWVGIDGDSDLSSDLLQAGTESDASCESQNYFAWYQWLPQNPTAVPITNFPVSPGDDIWIEVWNTSATEGYAYIFNYATGQAVNLSFQAISGTQLVGNTAEWVVERPQVNGSYSTLSGYASDYFSDCYADTYGDVLFTPSSPSTQLWTMCNSQTPCSSASMPISYPTLLGASAIQFQQESTTKKATF
jgi:Peptidase A4 family